MNTQSYIPALRFKWLTPLYDLLVGITMPERRIKKELIGGAGLTYNQQVLDFGCGTATLTMMAKESYPATHITGIDVDEEILQKANAKVRKKELNIKLLNYDGLQLPFLDNHFQTILSCLVFHHLTTENKKKALAELFRVVQKNGQLHIADFGRSAL